MLLTQHYCFSALVLEIESICVIAFRFFGCRPWGSALRALEVMKDRNLINSEQLLLSRQSI